MKLRNLLPDRLRKVLTENRKKKFGCVMLEFTFDELNDIHNIIETDDIFIDENDPSFGLEKNPHTTLLYGLHEEVGMDDIERTLDEHTFYTVKVDNPSLFEHEKFDVLKFDVTEGTLNRVNEKLKSYPHTSTYPDYHPHLTIAYLKSGAGKKYVEMINDSFDKEYWLAPKNALFSQINGTKSKIKIRID